MKYKRKLIERLRSIYDDDDFVNGVSSLIKTEEEYNDLMDAIENDDDPSQVQLNALVIMKKRKDRVQVLKYAFYYQFDY